MYVIRVLIDKQPGRFYLHGFSSGFVELSRSLEKAWFINGRGEAFSIAAAVHNAVYNLDPLLIVEFVSVDEEDLVDFDGPFSYQYLFVED